MRHRNGYRKLGRESAHRRAMLRNMATSFLEGGKIETTLPRAKELKPIVEKLITEGKKGSLHSRRQVASFVQRDKAVEFVFREYSKRFSDRPGGYTRIVKLGKRFGDGASLCRLELIDHAGEYSSAGKKDEAQK